MIRKRRLRASLVFLVQPMVAKTLVPEEGVIVFHTANRHLGLEPVVWTDDFSNILGVFRRD